MTRYQHCLAALCGFTCVYTSAESPAWLDDWYEIEVIIFVQPDVPTQETDGSTPVIYTEDLIVPAPSVIQNVTRAFPLTEEERARLRMQSNVVDLAAGDDPWFRPSEIRNGNLSNEASEPAISQHGIFPTWMLPPGESYDPFFLRTFEFVPFGAWFTADSLESLIEKDDEEKVEDDQGEPKAIETSSEPIDDPELLRQEILEQLDNFREELERTSYVMNEQNVRLPRTAERLRTKGAHVVKHFNWHQFVPSRSTKPEYVYFQSLNDYPTEGYFGVSKGRFIHLDVHIWMHQSSSSSAIRNPVYEMAELRRMQREDVHYFDHPRFGILAEVVKMDLPQELQALWDSLD